MKTIEEIKLTSSKTFNTQLLQTILSFENCTKEERKEKWEAINKCLIDLKAEYEKLKKELNFEVNQQLEFLQKEHRLALKEIEQVQLNGLNEIEQKYQQYSHDEKRLKTVLKDYEDSKKGVDIVAKRAKIKEMNQFDIVLKEEKLKKLFLLQDYLFLKSIVTGKKKSFKGVFQEKITEFKANFDIKQMLTNRKTWINLVPLFMLTLLIISFFVINSITGYKGNITDVINNGVFVAVVATGAVYIYSSGSFDMSLGPASLMCATIAAIVWNATGNLIIALAISLCLGAALGIVNAVLANVLDLPVMVMTLTMMNILNAIHAVILQTQGNQLNVKEGLPATTLVYATFLICFFLLLWVIFNYTKIGRRNKLIGSNAVAARFSGVSLMKSGIISFAISGIGLGIAGFLFASYNSGGSFSTGTILDTIGLNVVIAIVFGGMTTSGGPRSRVSCAVVGAFFCIFLDEVFKSLGAADYRFLAKGIIFLIVSFANMYNTRPKMLAR